MSDAPRERTSPRRINRIAEFVSARSYLEIGVAQGKTFLAVRIPHKVAVDPRFRFDVTAHQAPGVQFHEITSDAFFGQHPKSEKFDVIFIDGLHVFDQALRDFRNSLEVAHEGTVWLIDDVMPSDEFSAIPNLRKAFSLRMEATGVSGGAWHGDVFKVIFAIHDLHPEFSFVTAANRGNPQTIVWRAPRADVRPVFGSLEAIDRADYAAFLERRSLLNPQSENDALQTLFAALGPRGGGE